MGRGKCTGCGESPAWLTIENRDVVSTSDGRRMEGVVYVCGTSGCDTILGAGLHPVAMMHDTVAPVVHSLR
jgi:hypothetical protein